MQKKEQLHRLQFTDEELGAPRLKEHTRGEETTDVKPGTDKVKAKPKQKPPERPKVSAESQQPKTQLRFEADTGTDKGKANSKQKPPTRPKASTESQQHKAHLRFEADPGAAKKTAAKSGKPTAASKLTHGPRQALSVQTHRQIAEAEDDNVGVESAHAGEITAEAGVNKARSVYRTHRTRMKKESLRASGSKQEAAKRPSAAAHSNPISQRFQKAAIKRKYAAAKHDQAAATATTATVKRAAQTTAKAGAKTSAFVWRHKKGLFIVVVCFLVASFFMNALSSCSVIVESVTGMVAATSYPVEDEDILGAEAEYVAMEQELQAYLDEYESTHEYDEYHFDLDEIEHDPYVLISYITAWHGGPWTLDEIRDTLVMVFDKQYTLTETLREETRYRDGEPYTYTICYVTLENFNLSHLPIYTMSEEQMSMYAMFMSTLGNRPDLFPDSEYVDKYYGDGGLEYEIPPEALADEVFARMMEEAQKYIGYPYVWGGASPNTSFDCSGYVSWVINHSGWNYGRLGATALYYIGTPVSYADARPGDLVFFEGTYDTDGMSHCGIYVGNGMMLHCGDPIGYANLNSSYWQAHLAGFCRLPSPGG